MSEKGEVIAKVDQVNAALSKSPIIKGLIDGGLSLIPFFGQAITSVLDARAFQLFEKNTKHFVKELKQLVEYIDDEKLDKEFIESDEFISLLTEVLSRNARTYEDEKVRFFARVFINSAIHGMSKVPYKEGFVRIIDELSADHIRVLSFIYEKSLPSTEEDREENRDRVLASQISEALNIPGSRVLAYCEQMIRFGLLQDWGIGRYDYKPGSYEITDYGREFAAFLRQNV